MVASLSCAELGTAQPQLVLNFNDNFNLDVLINFVLMRKKDIPFCILLSIFV